MTAQQLLDAASKPDTGRFPITIDSYLLPKSPAEISEVMHAYFANFVKTGDPNASGLPHWPATGASASGTGASGAAVSGAGTEGADAQVMRLRIDVEPQAEPVPHRQRYQLFDQLFGTHSK